MPAPSLPIKKQLFIAAYIANNGNGTKAAIAAGYSQNAAGAQASYLLKDAKVRAEIEKRTGKVIEKLVDRYEVTQDKITRELAKIAFSNIGDYVAIQDDGSAIVDLSSTTEEQLAALTSIDVEEYTEGRGENAQGVKRVRIKLGDKRAALMDLAKLATMLPADRLQISGPGGGPVEIEHTNRNVDLSQLGAEQREQLRSLLLAAKRGGPVTDVEEVETEEDGDDEEVERDTC